MVYNDKVHDFFVHSFDYDKLTNVILDWVNVQRLSSFAHEMEEFMR